MKKVYKHIFLFAFLITFTISCENEDAKIINIDQDKKIHMRGPVSEIKEIKINI